jgi:aryl-alcohol dehydrogenase-like predicted oxidoreductase
MGYRQLGRSGLAVSTVGLGCNNFGRRLDLEASRAVVEAALELGITLFDTADVYGDSELFLGEILRSRRDEVVLATKFGNDTRDGRNGPPWQARASRRYVRRAVESSLRRLRTDWIDLYQLHRPDGRTPIEETLAALDELVAEGKVRYIGSSNFAGWQIAEADWLARTRSWEPFVSAQNEWSLLERDVEADVVPAAEHYGVGVLPYYPLASGLLTGKYRRDEPPPEGSRLTVSGRASEISAETFGVLEDLEGFAAEHGVRLLDVAIGWLAAQPSVGSVIAGATRAEQVRANVAALRWVPTDDDRRALDRICSPDR